jgi:aryl-alcohol dehydrogenase-like predicted oxidoreductase
MQAAGKIRHIGLFEVGVEQIRAARQHHRRASEQPRDHLEENVAAPGLELSDEQASRLKGLG